MKTKRCPCREQLRNQRIKLMFFVRMRANVKMRLHHASNGYSVAAFTSDPHRCRTFPAETCSRPSPRAPPPFRSAGPHGPHPDPHAPNQAHREKKGSKASERPTSATAPISILKNG